MAILARTHCVNGHDLDAVGVYNFHQNGRACRVCKVCHRSRSLKSMAKARAALSGQVVYPQSKAELDRFFSKVHKGKCWEWTGALQNKGYGVVTIRSVLVLAHRASYLIVHGSIPEGLELDHLCRNRPCVNPEHLEPVTHAENMRRSPIATRISGVCKNGHDDWVEYPSGGRHCRTCNLDRKRRKRVA